MIVYDDSLSYRILGSEVKFYSNETAYGWNVVAEHNNSYYYLGNQAVGIQLAVFFWQEQYGKEFSQEELKQIMQDNHVIV